MRKVLKRIALGIALIAVCPMILLTWLEERLFGPRCERVFNSCREILCLVPTPIGEFLRLAYYFAVCTDVSPDSGFLFGCMLAHRNTTIRAGARVGAWALIGCADIGENVLVGARCSVLSGKYQHGRPADRARMAGAAPQLQFETIRIGRNSWIGQDAVLMADVGENCSVGAGSVVYRPVPDGATVLGNPARKVSLSDEQSGVPFAGLVDRQTADRT